MSRLHLPRLGALLSGVVTALLVAGCGDEPTPPRLVSFTPAVLSVPAKEALDVSVEYEENDFSLEDFQWRADAGEIEGNGTPSIVYHAPEQPGDYRLSVTTHYGDDATELSLDAVVKVTPHIATEPPAVAAPPAAETAPAEASTEVGKAPEQRSAAAGAAGAARMAEGDEGASAAGPAVVQGATAPTAARERPEPEQAAGAAGGPDEAIDRAQQPLDRAAGTGGAEVAAGGQPSGPDAGAPAARTEAADAPTQQEAERERQLAALPTKDAAAAAGSRAERILDRRRLTAVVQIAFKPFSFYGEDGRRTGFEIDFLREFARRWLDDPNAVTYLPVPSDARIPTLLRGRADLIAAALTITPERAEQVDFSLIYFRDGQRLLVPKASEVAGVCDLAGEKVAAVEGSTSLDNIQAKAKECGFELGDLVTFRRHDDAVQALLDGKVDAFTSDAMALSAYAEGQPLKVVGDPFSEESYGFAVPKGDARLLQLIDKTLRQMEQDGTYAAIYHKWFGDAIAPYPLREPETVADTARADLGASPAPPTVEPSAGAPGSADSYVVQPGDTLSKIARKYYGEAWATSWQRIYEANRDVIGDDPGRLQVGMTLEIPK
jgi:ABC-type amino acid transport substrate-binding protein